MYSSKVRRVAAFVAALMTSGGVPPLMRQSFALGIVGILINAPKYGYADDKTCSLLAAVMATSTRYSEYPEEEDRVLDGEALAVETLAQPEQARQAVLTLIEILSEDMTPEEEAAMNRLWDDGIYPKVVELSLRDSDDDSPA